jgi:hypothetical protein
MYPRILPVLVLLALAICTTSCSRDPEVEAMNQQYLVAQRSTDSMITAYNQKVAEVQAARAIWKELRNNSDSNLGKEIRLPHVEIVFIPSSPSMNVKGWVQGDSDMPIWIRRADGSRLTAGEGIPKFYTGDKLTITGKLSGLSEGGLPIIDVSEVINLGV